MIWDLYICGAKSWLWLSFVRFNSKWTKRAGTGYLWEICVNALCSRAKGKISGPNKIVEVRWKPILHKKKECRTCAPPPSPLGGLCLETQGCFLTAIPDHTAKTVMAAIAIIVTDCWRGYKIDELRDAG